MELRHLRYFAAAAEEEHFSRAADRLCVTRPAVSQIVSALEEELGIKLFERKPRGLKLTAAGTVYFERIQRVFGELAQAADVAKMVGAGKVSILNVGYGSTTLHHAVFRIAVQQLRKGNPETRLALFEGSSVEQLQELRSGGLHLRFTHGLMPESSTPREMRRSLIGRIREDPEFGRLLIQFGRVAVALHSDHPLAKHESLALADLADEGFVVAAPHSSVSPSYGRLAALCHEAGFEARVIQQVRNTATQLDLVSVGLGVGLVVTLPGVDYGGAIVIRPLRDLGLATRFDLVWSRSSFSLPGVSSFVEIVRRLAVEQR
jgi:DNA-binding transcriptional LysR family regulator